MQLLSAEEFAAESKRYYEGDRRARDPQHLYRMIRHEDLTQVLGSYNWAVVRYPEIQEDAGHISDPATAVAA
jgi:hypothetical protein